MIATGKYKAQLFDAVKYKTEAGHCAVNFVWDLCGLGQRITSTLNPLDTHGRTNVMSVYDVRQWANRWDGRDLDWFSARLRNGDSFDVWLDITDGRVEFVAPRLEEKKATPSPSPLPSPRFYSTTPTVVRLVVDREVLTRLPDEIEPNFANAKTLFDAMTEKTEREDAQLVWALMAGKIGPMQVDFTSEQWAQMIAKIRELKSCCFTVRREREVRT